MKTKMFPLLKSLAILSLMNVPVFASAPGLNIESLNIYATSTNRNFKVNLNGKTVFLRIGRNNPGDVGIDRQSEIDFYVIADGLGIAPKLLAYEISNGLLITEYIDGASPTDNEIRQSDNIEKVIYNLRLLHGHHLSISTITPSTVFFRNDELLKTLDKLGLRTCLQEQINKWLDVRNTIEGSLYQGIPLGLCHGDLFRGNILQDNSSKLYFVDWEYSFYGYVIDDLGKFCSSNWLNDDEIAMVSRMYWGIDDDRKLRQLHQNIYMQQFNFFLWCQIQAYNNSKESSSFYEMANMARDHLNQMRETLKD